jgi:hypothetical protein
LIDGGVKSLRINVQAGGDKDPIAASQHASYIYVIQ